MNEEKSTRYQRLKRRASVLSLGWSVMLLGTLLVTGGSEWLRTSAATLASAVGFVSSRPLTVVFYVLLLMLVNELGSLPLAYHNGFVVEQRYGLSNQTLAGWLRDQLKAWLLGFILAVVAASIVYACIAVWPGRWWIPAGAIFALLIVGLANLAPVLLLPIFYTVKPLERDALKQRLLDLARRAGANVVGAYEWGLRAKTTKANAALTGLGATRRILVSDTMLLQYSDDEIEVVLAHELAHHIHNDIWKGVLLESCLILGGFFAASVVLARLAGPLGFDGVTDVAGLPLLLLVGGGVSLVMIPVSNALSRAYERSADRFALELTRNPSAFVSAMRRLGAQNLAEDDPSLLVQWLFYSHPPLGERIAFAQSFSARPS